MTVTFQVLPFYASSLTNDEEGEVAAAVAEPVAEAMASVSHRFLF